MKKWLKLLRNTVSRSLAVKMLLSVNGMSLSSKIPDWVRQEFYALLFVHGTTRQRMVDTADMSVHEEEINKVVSQIGVTIDILWNYCFKR